jgi:hypothetical protein
MRVLKNFVALCLLVLPAAAFADIYQLTPPPDLRIGEFTTQNGLTLVGSVDTINDALNTGCFYGECPYAETLVFSSNSLGFTITGNTASDPNVYTHTYLSGSYVPGSYKTASGGEVGIEYLVSFDDVSLWTALEQEGASYLGATDTQPATNLPIGTLMVFDLHSYGTGDAVADMTPAGTPVVTPEPATLTLLGSGMLAGLFRKRFAGNKK